MKPRSPERADRLQPSGLLLEVYLTEAQLALLLDMMRAGGWSTLSGVTRSALSAMALHLKIDAPVDAFRLDRKVR